ncbi:MAG: ATP-binding protein [Flavobacteriaceae bacterium]|nr:ATP-binding protein [Flavobacteriaceae bacterium]
MNNPFTLISYISPEYFCDRKEETKRLSDSLENGKNIVLLSLRRMGKTGLIKHLFYKYKSKRNVRTFYLDIMNTHSEEDFVNELAKAVLGSFHSKPKRIFDNVLKFLSKFNPVITLDPLTGTPSIEIRPNSVEQAKSSIAEILNYLENRDRKIIIAIDEFQQITKYKDSNFEAFLRSHIQHLKNINFIFSGSQQHILTAMFSSYSRPFYQSSEYLKLERIPQENYTDFIIEKFNKTGKKISKNIIIDLLDWADHYTYYVQNIFNQLWYISDKKVTKEDSDKTKRQLIDERDYIYQNLNNLLPRAQYELLKAIAKNKGIDKPLSKKFRDRYDLATTSTISTALKSLQLKELIYHENNIYKIYDVFMAKWLEEN